MSRVYGLKPLGDQLAALPASDEDVVKKKSSLRSIDERDEKLTANDEMVDSNKRSSLRMSLSRVEAVQSGKKLVDKNEKHSDPKLNISKSLQSTNASESSMLRNSRKREVKRAIRGAFWSLS